MRNLYLLLLLPCLALIVLGCSKDSYIEPPEEEGEVEVPYVPSAPVDGRVVLAYVTYYGSGLPNPELVTHINYAFAELYFKDGKYTGFKLQGKESRFKSVVALKKKNPNLKILLSFTNGVANSDNKPGAGFSVLSASEQMRKDFAEDCREFCEENGIDGIDIDWEYPGLGWSSQPCDVANDTKNHVLMMKQLRETLGTDYLLTYAGYVTNMRSVDGGFKYMDIKALNDIVDYVNIMTYDLDEGKKPHNAVACPSAYWDISRTYNAYMAAGVSPKKMVLGIPFYGRISFGGSPAAWTYRTIISLGPDYTIDNWDEQARVPYVTYKGAKYCYYDNARSIAYKADWALDRKFRGVMYWENDQDDAKFTLRKAAWEGVMGYK